MWYPTDFPILEATFCAIAPDATDIWDIAGPRAVAYSYRELLETTTEGTIF